MHAIPGAESGCLSSSSSPPLVASSSPLPVIGESASRSSSVELAVIPSQPGLSIDATDLDPACTLPYCGGETIGVTHVSTCRF
jgi:hypothetical protein